MNELAERLPRLLRPVLAIVALLGTITVGTLYGLPMALLFAAGSVLVWVISMFWTSVQSLAGETPLTLDEALSLGAPSAEEERKRAVLRALKDLEYERGVGKISEEDYADLSSRYREEAKMLLQILDRDLGPARDKALARLERRLKKEGLAAAARSSVTEADDASPTDDGPLPKTGAAADARNCASCGTPNDSDARFCKRCGMTIEAEEIRA